MISAAAAQQARDEAREKLEATEEVWLRRQERCSCSRPVLGRMYCGLGLCERCGKLTRFWRSALKRNGSGR